MVLQQVDEILEQLNVLDQDLLGDFINVDEVNSQINIRNKIVNIIHLNIRSVRKNFDHLLLLIQT